MTLYPDRRDTHLQTYGKHAFAYVFGVFRACIAFALLASVFYFNVAFYILTLFEVPVSTPAYIYIKTWGNPALTLILLLSAISELYRILVLFSTSIKVDGDSVQYNSGILPWSSYSHHWNGFQIFSSSYIQSGFVGWLFSYGSVIITGKEGVTSNFTVSSMWRPKSCSIAINGLVRQ